MSKLVIELDNKINEVSLMVAYRSVDSCGVVHYDTFTARSSVLPNDVLSVIPDVPDYLKD